MSATNLLKSVDKYGMIHEERRTDRVTVDRCELEEEHLILLRRLHQLRRILGYPPIMTGKKRRDIRDE